MIDLEDRGVRLLANENFPGPVICELRRRSADVAWIREDSPGASDADVRARAQRESRNVVTQNKDCGELAVRYKPPASCGILLFRMNASHPNVDNPRMVAAVLSRDDWARCLEVIHDDRVRIRPLRLQCGPMA